MRLSIVIALAGFAAAACGGLEMGIETAAPPTVPAPTQAAPAPTLAPTETEAAAGNLLPAPLYFVLLPGAQIWRLGRDGSQLTQITFEAAPVTAFDVSPVDGRLAYVSGNTLIQTDASGGNRVELANGPATFGSEQANRELTNPRWSVDGRQVAFGLNGINLIEADGGRAPRLILQNSPVPSDDPAATQSPDPVRFYRPVAWSPDGGRLLLEMTYFPHGGGWMALDLATGGQVEISPPEGFACCDAAWSNDGAAVYFANGVAGQIAPGLWRADPATGETVTLIQGPTATGMTLVQNARQLADGALYFFLAQVTGIPEDDPALVMHRARDEGGGLAGLAALPVEGVPVAEALWDPAGRGAAVILRSSGGASTPSGDLLWVPVAGPASGVLMPNATQLHWGVGE